jgi:hypothetical protein
MAVPRITDLGIDEIRTLERLRAPSIIVEKRGEAAVAIDAYGRIVAGPDTDHAAVLQTALNQKAGRRVAVRGTLTLPSMVNVPADTVLDLTEATLKLPDTLSAYSEILRIAGDNVEIIGGLLDGGANGVSTASRAINCRGYSNVTVRGAKFQNILVGVEAWGKNIRVLSCDFVANVRYCVNDYAGSIEDLTVEGCNAYAGILMNIDGSLVPSGSVAKNIVVRGCRSYAAGTFGIAIATENNFTVQNLTVSDCQFLGPHPEAFHTEDPSIAGVYISNCYFRGPVEMGYGTAAVNDIAIQNAVIEAGDYPNKHGLELTPGTYALVKNVVVRKAPLHGVKITGGGGYAYLENVIVEDPSGQTNYTYYGFWITNRAKMVNCAVYTPAGKVPLRGASIEGQYSELHDCEIRGSSYGLYVNADDVKVLGGNYYAGWQGTIYIAGRQRTKIVAAHIARQASPYAGVVEGGDSDYTKIIDCVFYGTGNDVVLVGANSKNVVL